jgi:uncharacterized protein
MTSFFPDLNVWLALSVASHKHSADAWAWKAELSRDARLIFARHTQIGLLRLLTNASVMGEQTLILRAAWDVFDQWLEDPQVEFHPEPRNVDLEFKKATRPFASKAASKWVGDCWLLALAVGYEATLVTFDSALHDFARKEGHSAVVPG